MQTELLEKLQQSGLTKREAYIYLALLQKQEFAASEIASIIPIGRTKIYEVIPNLIAKGLCNETVKDGKKMYSAVEPKIALKNLLSLSQQEYKNKENTINQLGKELEKMYEDSSKKSGMIDYIEVLKDLTQIRNKWLELQAGIKKELLSFNKAPYSVSLEQNVPYHDELMKKKKITERGIYEYGKNISGKDLESFVKTVEIYSKLGEDARVIEELPMKMMIIDSKITMLALNDPVSMKPSITTIIVTHPSYALALKEVFESYWTKAITINQFKEIKKLN